MGEWHGGLGKEYFVLDPSYVSPLPIGYSVTGNVLLTRKLRVTNTIVSGEAGPEYQVSEWFATGQHLSQPLW